MNAAFAAGLAALIGLFVLVGAALAARFYAGGARATLVGLISGTVLYVGGTVIEVRQKLLNFTDHPGWDDVMDYIGNTEPGTWVLWSCAAVLALLLLGMLRRWTPRLLDLALNFLALVVLVSAVTMKSHAGAMSDMGRWLDPRVGLLLIVAEFVHVGAVLCWGGPLPYLSWTRPRGAARREVYAAAVQRFSTVAGVCAALFIASGLYLAWDHVARWQALTSTWYGQVLLVKLTGVAAVLLLAAYNRWRALPRLGTLETSSAALRPLRRAMQVEAIFLLLIVGATYVLASADPPCHSEGTQTMETVEITTPGK